MALFKCKICGGTLDILQNSTTAECAYCGSMQTLPRVNNDRLASFYERANDLRMSHEFDKAAEIYEKIIEENPTDADVYWSMVLCRYGIEYVEETAGGIRKPTINRAQMISVFEDVNYRSAIKYADSKQMRIYEEEAARIDRILQRYLEISRNEPAYDVFICYKETDANGDRTIDSVRAGEIYRELTAEGFKVFFAPVTLESKLGEDYEPYIFAALHSAKVMVVIGTKPEHMNAVWVKNEWSRFLTLAKENSQKTLIPVYGGMDPYDMPEAFRFKQSQNMEKLGFMLDLVRGIEKLVGRNKTTNVVQPAAYQEMPTSTATASADTLLQRAFIFLEDQDWANANIYCEKVLDMAPTNGMAYFYKLLAEAKVTSEGELQAYHTPLENLRAYKNAIRYGNEATTSALISYNKAIKQRLVQKEKERLEQERIQREQEQLAAQRRKEQAKLAEERRKAKQALTNAIDNTSNLIMSQVQQKERLESLLEASQRKLATLEKPKRKVRILSILTFVNNAVLFALLSNDSSAEVGLPCLILTFVLVVMLASARQKSKVAAFLLTIATIFIYPFFAAIKGLCETFRNAATELQAEQESLRASLQQVESELNTSRNALHELNNKKTALESNTEGASI